jgi:hypothetical protein
MEQKQLPPLIIPGFVVKKPISHTAMVLYGMIFSLQREEGYAYASNAYYAEELGLSIASIKRYLKELTDARLILVHLDRKATDLVQRKIFLYSSMTAFRAYEEESGGQLKSEPCIQETTREPSSSSSSRLSRDDLEQVITPIYKSYPRKIGKNLGLDRLYQKHFKFDDIEKFGIAVMNYANYCKKNKTDQQYILQFSTFVGRWRDWFEVEQEPKSNSVTVTSVTDLQNLFAPKTWDGTNEN